MFVKQFRKFDVSTLQSIFIIVSLLLGITNLFFQLVLVVGVSMWANKDVPSLVQLRDGRSITTEAFDSDFRTPEITREFVRKILMMMFTWQPSNHQSGIEIDGNSVTVNSWEASFAFQEELRPFVLSQVSEMTPQEVFKGAAQSALSIESIGDPSLLEDGNFEVDVVANLVIFSPNHPQGTAVPFNKTIVLHPIPPHLDPLPEDSSPIQQAVYRTRESGLEIVEMRDLDL